MAQQQSIRQEVWDIISSLVLDCKKSSNSDILINPYIISVANVLSTFTHPEVGAYKLHAFSIFKDCNPSDLILYNYRTQSLDVYTSDKYLIRSIPMP